MPFYALTLKSTRFKTETVGVKIRAEAHTVITAMAISGFALLLITLGLNVFGAGVSWYWIHSRKAKTK